MPAACGGTDAGTPGTGTETPGTGTETPGGEPEETLQTFTGITFADRTVTYDGTEQEMFRLRQSGMRLMWAPKVLWDEAYLYVLFGGGQNLPCGGSVQTGPADLIHRFLHRRCSAVGSCRIFGGFL